MRGTRCPGAGLRIAFVLGSLQVGGTETQVCRLARELSRSGHHVGILVLGRSGPLEEQLAADGLDFEVFGYDGPTLRDARRRLRPWVVLWELRKVLALWRSLRRRRPDVCHAFLYWAYVLALPGAVVAGVPLRVSGRRGSSNVRGARAWLQRLSNRCAHVVAGNSEAVVTEVSTRERVGSTKLRVVRNGVDIPDVPAEPAREPAVGLMVANFIPYKGHADVVRALSLLDHPPTLRLVGAGRELDRVSAMVHEAGLDNVVRIEGPRANAAELFTEVQFSVLASHEESLPNAVLEAMAAGIPVIATRVGGVAELVEPGVTGILVPPRDPEALAAAIKSVTFDPALRARLGDAGRCRAAAFSWEASTHAHAALYRELLGRA